MTFPQGKVIYNDLPCLRGLTLELQTKGKNSMKTAFEHRKMSHAQGLRADVWYLLGPHAAVRSVCDCQVLLLHPVSLIALYSVKARCLALNSEHVNALRLCCKSYIDMAGQKRENGSAGTSKL